MAYDLNILCVMQKRRTEQLPFPAIFEFDVEHRSKNSYPKYYNNNWHFMNSCSGFWYYLFPKDEAIREQDCGCGEFCEIQCVDKPAPTNHCFPDELAEHIRNRLNASIWIKKKYRRDFEKTIDYFLSASPVNMIIFLPRWQFDDEQDIVHGVITRYQFFAMMKNKQIRLNMCYIIRK